jgi:hypothetical protein
VNNATGELVFEGRAVPAATALVPTAVEAVP